MEDKELRKALEEEFFRDYGYTEKQMQEVMDFIKESFGDEGQEEKYILHELESEYVHTDVVMPEGEDYNFFVSCGMGARVMPNCKVFIDKAYERIELYFSLSKEYKPTLEEVGLLGGELQGISKYPFRNNTFLGPGHTINASKKFKEKFGYDYFVFLGGTISTCVEDLGEVYFMGLIPIYEEERNWMVENNSFEWLIEFFNSRDDENFVVDKKREVFIPNEK